MARLDEGMLNKSTPVLIILLGYDAILIFLYIHYPQSAGILLATFEADSSSSSELKQAKRRRQQQKEKAIAAAAIDQSKNDNSSADPRSDYMGCKYLTSSQLFLLELQDPSIRQQLVIQLLVFLCYFFNIIALQTDTARFSLCC